MVIRTFGDDEYSVVRIEGQVPKSMEMNPLAILTKNWLDLTYYDRDGRKFAIRPTSGHTLAPAWLWRVFAFLITKPRTVTFEAIEQGSYSLDELKTKVIKWVA